MWRTMRLKPYFGGPSASSSTLTFPPLLLPLSSCMSTGLFPAYLSKLRPFFPDGDNVAQLIDTLSVSHSLSIVNKLRDI